MIEIYGFRKCTNSGTIVHDYPSLYLTKIENALISLVKYELGYGGEVSSIEEIKDQNRVRITTLTRVMNKLDTTVFEGSKEDMQPLLNVSYIVMTIRDKGKDQLIEHAIDTLGESGGLPFILVNLAPLLVGDMSVKTALLIALGCEPESELFQKLKSSSIEDLCAAWALNNYKIGGIVDILQ